ncbi:MAG: class I SAM-dependent methyltransferase, partial [Candidatus Peribacteraceae bacterium]
MYRFWSSIIEPALSAAHARSIVEIGTADGKTTLPLLRYAKKYGGSVHCIDPKPLFDSASWEQDFPGIFRFHRGLSLDVLPNLPAFDAVLIDGDHNWYTVFHELTIIANHAKNRGRFPLVLLHDVCWPYGRRDLYHDPLRIPKAFRHPWARKGMSIGNDALADNGFNDNCTNAIHEGGPRNGVLTAIEDFLAEHGETLRFVIVPGSFGLGILADCRSFEEHPPLQKFWRSLTLAAPIRNHIESLERAFITAETCDQRCLHDFQRLEQTTTALRTELAQTQKQLTQHHAQAAAVISRMKQTKSWRYTALFRHI